MAEQKDVSAQGQTNESSMEEESKERIQSEADAIAEGYSTARKELNDILERIRTEFRRLDAQEARSQFADWVRKNPELSVLIALGAGAVMGRLIAELFRPAPPPPFSVRARKEGERLAREARKAAGVKSAEWAKGAQQLSKDVARLGDEWSQIAIERGELWRQRAGEAAMTAGKRAAEYGEQAARRTQETLAEVAEEASKAAERASREAGPRVKGLKKAAVGKGKETTKRARKAAESVQDAATGDSTTWSTAGKVARAVLTAFAVKKAVQWVGRSFKK